MAMRMSQNEITEGRRAGIPEYLLGKMIYGLDLSEREKEVVKGRGKVYVLGHRKYGGRTIVDPQLRDLPRGSLFLGNPGHKVPVVSKVSESDIKIRLSDLTEQFEQVKDDLVYSEDEDAVNSFIKDAEKVIVSGDYERASYILSNAEQYLDEASRVDEGRAKDEFE